MSADRLSPGARMPDVLLDVLSAQQKLEEAIPSLPPGCGGLAAAINETQHALAKVAKALADLAIELDERLGEQVRDREREERP